MASTVLAYATSMTDDLDFAGASQALAGVEQLDVPAMELLYKLECSGEDFYNLLADRIGDDEAAELFRRNGKEELGHARRIARAIAIKLGHEYEPPAAMQERYAIELPDPIDPAMLPGIVAGEQAGDAGYQTLGRPRARPRGGAAAATQWPRGDAPRRARHPGHRHPGSGCEPTAEPHFAHAARLRPPASKVAVMPTVGTAGELPATLVARHVVTPAEQRAVLEVRLAALQPVHEVVHVAPRRRRPAPRILAVLVA